jgi:DNA (cytosine-5)-methyltransferase 1
MTPRVLDLFCGAAGGWSLGLHRAGFRTVAACEIDPWRRAVYARNFPGVKLYDDVRTLTAARLAADLGYLPDIIAGSPPCQDASAANAKGKGVDGARTGLFFEAIRIVGECRPRWCAFENVPHLRTKGYDQIGGGLEKIGYAAWPQVVGADDFQAPHIRKRVWIVAAAAACFRSDSGQSLAAVQARGRPASRRQSAVHSEHAAYADGQHGRGRSRAAQAGRRGAAEQCAAETRHADRIRRAQVGKGLGRDARAQLAALARAIGPEGLGWNHGPAGSFRMAHGLSARLAAVRVADHRYAGATINLAKACASAYGDAILPQISEAIGRAILRVEAALAIVGCAP